MDLQYLPEDKKREDDPDIRKMLLETLILVRTASQIFHLFYLSFACIEVNDLHNHSNVWGDKIFFFYIFESLLCSSRLHLYDQKYSKTVSL